MSAFDKWDQNYVHLRITMHEIQRWDHYIKWGRKEKYINSWIHKVRQKWKRQNNKTSYHVGKSTDNNTWPNVPRSWWILKIYRWDFIIDFKDEISSMLTIACQHDGTWAIRHDCWILYKVFMKSSSYYHFPRQVRCLKNAYIIYRYIVCLMNTSEIIVWSTTQFSPIIVKTL